MSNTAKETTTTGNNSNKEFKKKEEKTMEMVKSKANKIIDDDDDKEEEDEEDAFANYKTMKEKKKEVQTGQKRAVVAFNEFGQDYDYVVRDDNLECSC